MKETSFISRDFNTFGMQNLYNTLGVMLSKTFPGQVFVNVVYIQTSKIKLQSHCRLLIYNFTVFFPPF